MVRSDEPPPTESSRLHSRISRRGALAVVLLRLRRALPALLLARAVRGGRLPSRHPLDTPEPQRSISKGLDAPKRSETAATQVSSPSSGRQTSDGPLQPTSEAVTVRKEHGAAAAETQQARRGSTAPTSPPPARPLQTPYSAALLRIEGEVARPASF